MSGRPNDVLAGPGSAAQVKRQQPPTPENDVPSDSSHSADDHLGDAQNLLENALLYLDVDRPDPKNSTYSKEQILQLWDWYKQRTGKNIDAYERFLSTPFTPDERAELEHLASRMGWSEVDLPGGLTNTTTEHREAPPNLDLQPHAWKYKKLKDLETVLEARKHLTPEMREAYLASKGAPLDVISAKEIDMDPDEVVPALDKRAADLEQQAQREFAERDFSPYYKDVASPMDLSKYIADYSEESEWWPGWSSVSYADLPSQPFLQAFQRMVLNYADSAAAKGAATNAVATQAAAAADAEETSEEGDPQAVLWRALPLDLDPFVLLNSGRSRQALAEEARRQEEAEQWAARKRAFLVSAVSVVGFAAFRWFRKRMAARRRRANAKLRQPMPLSVGH